MPAGRPEKPIDKKTFEKLCGMQATEEEICGFFDVTDKTLAKWCRKTYGLKFSEVFKIKGESENFSAPNSMATGPEVCRYGHFPGQELPGAER